MGDRFPFHFHSRQGELSVRTASSATKPVTPVGKIRAVLFWPYLFSDWEFVTSTGKFMVMMGTGILKQSVSSPNAQRRLMYCCSSVVRALGNGQFLIVNACSTIHVGKEN